MSAGRPDWEPGFILAGQDANVKVDVEGGNIDANITNAIVNANIKDSEVTLDVAGINTVPGAIEVGEEITTPDTDLEIEEDFAKIFPHGVKGWVDWIRIYFKNTSSSDITVQVSLRYEIEGPDIITKTLSIRAGYDGWIYMWEDFYWPYDTMVIVIKKPDASGLRIGLFYGPPYDSLWNQPGYWALLLNRLAVRVRVISRSAPGVLVTGEVVAVKRPTKQYHFNKDWVSADPSSEVTILTIRGRGRLRYILWIVSDSGFADSVLRIYADGNVVTGYYFDGPGTLNYYGLVDKDTQPRLLKYDPNKPEAILVWNEEVEFYRELRLALHNYDSNNPSKIRILAMHYVLE